MPGAGAGIALDDEAAFLDFVKECFAQKRKTLRNNLRARLADQTEKILNMAGLPPGVRAEALTVTQFAELFGLVRERKI
jgi:16S rRNA (adenine1518-N6/adenine1519-N6)-dimethyltransferase